MAAQLRAMHSAATAVAAAAAVRLQRQRSRRLRLRLLAATAQLLRRQAVQERRGSCSCPAISRLAGDVSCTAAVRAPLSSSASSLHTFISRSSPPLSLPRPKTVNFHCLVHCMPSKTDTTVAAQRALVARLSRCGRCGLCARVPVACVIPRYHGMRRPRPEFELAERNERTAGSLRSSSCDRPSSTLVVLTALPRSRLWKRLRRACFEPESPVRP